MKNFYRILFVISSFFVTPITGAQTMELIIADFENNIPTEDIVPGKIQMYSSGSDTIMDNPSPDSLNNSQKVARFVKPEETYQLLGFYFTVSIRAWRIKKIEFLIHGNVEEMFVQLSPQEGEPLTLLWQKGYNFTGWNKFSLDVNLTERGDSITNLNIFPDMELALADTFYIDSVRFTIDTTTLSAVESVMVTPETLELMVGESFTVSSTVLPENADNKQVAWVSDNTDAASVNEYGQITTNAPGFANIIVITEEGGFKDTCKLTVIPYVPGAVDTIIANWEDVIPDPEPGPGVWQYFTSGGSSEIIANPVSDEDNLTPSVLAYYRPAGEWMLTGFFYQDGIPISNNMTGVEFKIYGDSLKICYAKLIGIVDGTADQTIVENPWPWTAPSGAGVWNTIVLPIDTGTFLNDTLKTILIFPNPQLPDAVADTFYIDDVKFLLQVPVDSVVLNAHEVILDPGESIYLEAFIYPADASNQNITWTTSDPGVATVSSIGKVQAGGPGNADIIVKTEDSNVTDTCHITVRYIDGLSCHESGNIRIWPNPFHDGNLFIYLPESPAGKIGFSIYNLQGRLVYSSSVYATVNTFTVKPELQNGLYIIKIEYDEKILYAKLISK